MDELQRLKEGKFNFMSQVKQPDGTVLITLSSHGDKKAGIIRVKNLYELDEEELNVTTGEPIAKRDLRKAVPDVPGKSKRYGKGKDS